MNLRRRSFRPILTRLEERAVPTTALAAYPTPLVAFDAASSPVGAAVTRSNQVVVSRASGAESFLELFDRDGALVDSFSVPFQSDAGHVFKPIIPTGQGDPLGLREVFAVYPDGSLLHYDFDNPSSLVYATIGLDLSLVVTSVYNVQTGTLGNMSSSIEPDTASYADVCGMVTYTETSIGLEATGIDIYLTGLSGSVPFVAKLNYDLQIGSFVDGAVTHATLTAPEGPPLVRGPGVAINPAGDLLSSLPYAYTNNAGVARRRVTAFHLNPGTPLFARDAAGEYPSLPSNGMEVDRLGDFYIATGSAGTSLENASTGAVVIVPRSLSAGASIVYRLPGDHRDVALFGTTLFLPNATERRVVAFGTAPTAVGVHNASISKFFLDRTGNARYDGPAVDSAYQFGIASDVPLAGDWNGDGRSDIGVWRSSNATFYLDRNNNGRWDGSPTDGYHPFGSPGDVPVLGDWNGDRRTDIGVWRPGSRVFFIDHNGNGRYDGAVTDRQGQFGIAGDVPLVGDWNGDGRSDVGLWRPGSALFFLDRNQNLKWDGTVVDNLYAFGASGDRPLVGDWSGSGRSKIGVWRSSNATFYLDRNGNGRWDGGAGDLQQAFGAGSDTPLLGDWNGAGRTLIGVWRSSNANFYLDRNGNGRWDGGTLDVQGWFGSSTDTPLTGVWNGASTAGFPLPRAAPPSSLASPTKSAPMLQPTSTSTQPSGGAPATASTPSPAGTQPLAPSIDFVSALAVLDD